MTERLRKIVLDTNVFLSAILWPASTPGKAYAKALLEADFLLSQEVQVEYSLVMKRPKFDSYLHPQTRSILLEAFVRNAVPVVTRESVKICRDPRDNIFLELALSGNADLILSGDADLLSLHPWRGIPILSPRDYL